MDTCAATPDDPSNNAKHRANNFLSRVIACAEGAMDAAENPQQVRALMELLIECAENAPDLFASSDRNSVSQVTACPVVPQPLS